MKAKFTRHNSKNDLAFLAYCVPSTHYSRNTLSHQTNNTYLIVPTGKKTYFIRILAYNIRDNSISAVGNETFSTLV